jgi:hypothetical protein
MNTRQMIFKPIKFTLAVLVALALSPAIAQVTNIGINPTGALPHPSAIVDVSSTTGGVLFPRMTAAQKLAIAAPVNGLTIFQTDGAQGHWYYDGTQWRFLGRYINGTINMNAATSTIVNGSGFTVTRLADGIDQIDFDEPYPWVPNIQLSHSRADGAAPNINTYCNPIFTTCACDYLRGVELFSGAAAGGTQLINNTLNNLCTTNPNAYTYHPPGHPVYTTNPPNICLNSPIQSSFRLRGDQESAGACASSLYTGITAWIDWQQDGFFDNIIDKVVENPNGGNWPAAVVYTFAHPPGISAGNLYCRVMARPLANTGTIPLILQNKNPCTDDTNSGETEDYVIHVTFCGTPPVYQDINTVCTMGDPTINSFRVTCKTLNGTLLNIQKYYFQVNENN